MAITYKDISQLSQKSVLAGTEKIPVSATEYITPAQIGSKYVPTISTNIASDKTSDTKTASPKAVYSEIHPANGSSQPAGGMLPNVLYNLGTLTGSVTISLASATDSSVANHWYFTFETGGTAPTITWPASITSWLGGNAPTINASKHYEISVLGGIGVAMEV